ncbi:DUF3231 family protein [Virgibacillus necropolis]|uniref:DUF3231 family protein n=1 Tax=Virgibacillus necropolis TaxID=163877 RepID=UPI00384FFF78
MTKDKLKLTSSEIGSLWGEYINGTMSDVIIRYMVSIIEDDSIKAIFEDALKTFGKQKKQIVHFIEEAGFPVPIGFSESDLNKGTPRLFTDVFCLNYLYIMTLHGLIGHTTSLGISVREDLRHFYDSCQNDGKNMYHQTVQLLLEKGEFQRDPYLYPKESPEFITTKDFTDGFFGKGRHLAATEIISISLSIKKSIMAKTLCIAFSQVAQSKEVRKFFSYSVDIANGHIKGFSKILQTDNLPSPGSWESEVTTSTESPFSDKLMMYHIGFLSQVAQAYYGTGLASAMRTDLVATYETTILRNLKVTKKWFNIMVQNKWLEQPPLAPNRKEIAKEK